MQDPNDALLFFDDLSPAQQQALRAALAEDPVLADAFAQWRQVRAAVRERLHADVPDRRLLVLYALEAAGRADVLSPDEQQALGAARPALEQAAQRHPALADVVAHVEACCADFEAAWDAHFDTETRPARKAAPDRRAARPARRPVLRWGWRAVATVALAAFVAVLVLIVQRDRSLTTVHVAEGQTRLVELADGSTVRLLGGAALTYADPARAGVFNRRVRLSGRAFFDVAPDRQGFTVETPTALATVLGTSFGIQAHADAMEVVLATGRLSVASKAAQERFVVLEPGQMSRVSRDALPTTPAPVDLAEALAWTGLFLFRATPLEDAAARLSARYGVAVSVAQPLRAERVTGTFEHAQPLDEILQTLATTLEAAVAGSAAEGYRLTPAGRE